MCHKAFKCYASIVKNINFFLSTYNSNYILFLCAGEWIPVGLLIMSQIWVSTQWMHVGLLIMSQICVSTQWMPVGLLIMSQIWVSTQRTPVGCYS